MNNTEKKLPKWLIVLFVIVFLLLLFVFCTPNNDNEEANISSTTISTTKTEVKSVKVDAKTLIHSYNENEKTADTKYKNNQLIVSNAIVYSVDENYVKLECNSEEFWLDYIDAYYNSNQKDSVQALQKGDKITVTGECKGLSSWGDIKLWNCTFK